MFLTDGDGQEVFQAGSIFKQAWLLHELAASQNQPGWSRGVPRGLCMGRGRAGWFGGGACVWRASYHPVMVFAARTH